MLDSDATPISQFTLTIISRRGLIFYVPKPKIKYARILYDNAGKISDCHTYLGTCRQEV